MSIAKLRPSWLPGFVALLVVFMVGLISIALERPVGAIAGVVTLEQPGFQLQSGDMRGHRVYALAVGPRGGDMIERGVWVNPDGTFELTQLPVGEYSLTVRGNGFATWNQQGIFVDDARTFRLADTVALRIQDPSVNIASSQRVFTTRETPAFWVSASGSNEVQVRLYRKDMLSLIQAAEAQPGNGLEFSSDLSLYKPYGKNQTRLFADEKPLQTLTRPLSRDQEDWSRADFKLNKPLPAGEYVAVAEVSNLKGTKDWNVMWFSVSDLGLIVKQAPEKTVVRAISLTTLKPLANVDVRLLPKTEEKNASTPLASLKTGADGFAVFPIPTAKQSNRYNFLALGVMGAHRAFGGVDYWLGGNNTYETYFYTERPIYRLGQTVYFKGISRLRGEHGLQTPKPGTELAVTVEDPDNNKVWEGKLTTSKHGTFNGLYNVPADGKTGGWQITVNYPNGNSTYHRFEVAQYRKPEYQVDVLPLEKRVVAGQKVRARIRATYYFGAPVTNARIKYSVYADTDWNGRYHLMPRPDYYGYYDGWSDDEESSYSDASYAGVYITEGYAQTDETGEAVVEFDTQAMRLPKDEPWGGDYLDRRYTVQAEVTDLSRMTVVGSGVQSVTAGDFALFVQPDHYVTKAGSPVGSTVSAVDYEGKPVANRAVTVSLLRWKYDQIKGEYRGTEVIETQSVTTDSQGHAKVTLATPDKLFTDGYYLTAQASDEGGRAIYDQASIWIASENYPYVRNAQMASQEAFSVKLDKAVYKPGETARAMITAPLTGKENAQVLVAIEGERLHEYWVVPMNATAKMVEIPLKSTYAPNVYVSATLVGQKHQFYHAESMIKVSPEEHFLKLAITTDKPKYRPGDTVTYTVKATYPDGRPAADTELSLGVVDESIYAIRPESARDIRKFFYNKRYNAVLTLSSFPEEYSGGPDKIEPRLRKDFRDVAAWLPNLITDQNGVATVQVKLPDNLTTWRATVRGVSLQTDVGSEISKVLATQDLIVRLALPRFFTQHDDGLLTAIVHNYTEKPQQVTVTLTPSKQFETSVPLVQKLSVKPDGAERYSWPVKVALAGNGLVNVKAVGETDGDAMELKIPVRPLGIEVTRAVGGVLKDVSAEMEWGLKLPEGMDPQLAKLIVSVSASSIGPVLGNFDALIDYPYGCTEQTMSRLMPSVIALKLNKALQVPLSEEARKRFDQVMLKAIAKLKDARNDDGGWGWWRYDESQPFLTAYVMEGLYLLNETGDEVARLNTLPSGWRQEGLNWLRDRTAALTRQLSDPKLVADRWQIIDRQLDLAYMQYVLSLYGEKPAQPLSDYMLGQRKTLPPEVLSYMTLVYKRSGNQAAAEQMAERLGQLADPSGDMLNWDHSPALMKKLGWADRTAYTYRYSGVESTALGLRALLAARNPMGDPASDSSLVSRAEAVERWLILQRNHDGWANTKTTAQVLRAMMEKALILDKPTGTHFTVASNLWASPMSFGSSDWAKPERTVKTTAATLSGGAVKLAKQGLGSLYYNSLLSYMMPLKPGDAVRHEALPQGLKIRRAFYRIQAEPVGPEGVMRFKTKAISDGRVKAGEIVLMKVIVDAPVALPYVIVDAALPSGGEVVSEDPRLSLVDSETDDVQMNGDWGQWWWTHQDILDDRVVMFATSMPAGQSEMYALVRMELPGTFRMNPVRLEGMYSPRIRAYSALDEIRVVE